MAEKGYFDEYFKDYHKRKGGPKYEIHSCPELIDCIQQVGFLPLLDSGIPGVLEPLQPVVEVDAAFAYGVEGVFGNAAGNHLVVEMVVAHVAGAAVGVGHHHNLLNSKLVDGHDKAAHGRVESRDYQSAGVFDDFRVAVFQSEGGGKQLGKTGVHARKHRQFFVGVLVGDIPLVTLTGNEIAVVVENLVYHGFKK